MSVINLRQAKKARSRADKAAKGTQRAAEFGRTKAQKELEKAERQKAKETLDQHKRAPE
ncbi:MAG: DUF4169 family protein [Pseudomonadota bacterium]